MPVPGRRTPWALFALALAHGLLYWALTPPWQGPDEIAHFEYAHLLARYRRPVTAADASPTLEAEIIRSLYTYRAWDFVPGLAPAVPPARLAEAPFFGRSRTLGRFSLGYVPYALAAWPLLGLPVAHQLMALRLLSVLSGSLVVLVVYRAGRLLAPAAPALAYGAAALVLLLPQHAFLHATVSDSHLAELLASLALYQLLAAQCLGVTPRRLVWAGLCAAGALLSKTIAYYLLPLAALWAADLLRDTSRQPAGRLPAAGWLLAGLSLAAAAAVVVSLSSQPLNMAREALAAAAPWVWGPRALDLAASGALLTAVLGMAMSFWGVFGWMAAPLPGAWYVGLAAAGALSVWGWARRLRNRAVSRADRVLWLAAALPLAGMWAWFLLSPAGIYAYQGRYLFGALVPVALLLVGGWLALASRQPGRVLSLVVGGLALVDAAALFGVLMPFFERGG